MTRRGLFQLIAAAFVARRLPVSKPPVDSVEFMCRAIKGAMEAMSTRAPIVHNAYRYNISTIDTDEPSKVVRQMNRDIDRILRHSS